MGSIVLKSSSGPVGSYVHIAILGVKPSSPITATFAHILMTVTGNGTTDANGNLDIILIIPFTDLGDQTLSISDGLNTTTATYTVIEEDSQVESDNITLLENYTSTTIGTLMGS